ncbi:MAG: hypothetical protein ACJA01_003055 [Saprospiraceae bacterium]|jgi:hypothetical protein
MLHIIRSFVFILCINIIHAPKIVAQTVLFDNNIGIDPPAFAVVSSAFTDILLGAFKVAGADDFTVPNSGWRVNLIRAFGNYSNSVVTGNFGPATSVNVYILPKTGSIPSSTDIASIAFWSGESLDYTEIDPLSGGDFEIAIPEILLPGGDYWLIVQPNIELFAVGQWNWTETSLIPNSGTTNGDESTWFQSIAGVNSPVTNMIECVGFWGRRVTDCSMTRNTDTNQPADRDLAFQIEGELVPPIITEVHGDIIAHTFVGDGAFDDVIINGSVNVGQSGLHSTGDISTSGFSQLGSDAPAIKIKKLTGTTPATQGASVTINHELDSSKFISVNAIVKYAGTSLGIMPGYTFEPNLEYHVSWTTTNVGISITGGNSANITNDPFVITIIYEE